MSRVRASSQGPRRGAAGQPLSLEQMRERMLTRRNVDLRMNPADVQRPAERPPTSGTAQPLFVGRSLVINNSPPHPNSTPSDDAADPHKLFQMLRRKKRAAAPDRASGTPTAVPVPRHSPDRAQPHPGVEPPSDGPLGASPAAGAVAPPPPPPDVPPRPQGAGRPLGAMRHAYSAGPTPATPAPVSQQGPRQVSSAGPRPSGNGAPDGRPVTRQKLPTQALDLFPSSSGGDKAHGKAATVGDKVAPPPNDADADPFPKPAANGHRTSGGRPSPSANTSVSPSNNNGKPPVDFSCLFVSGEGDLGMPDEFPSPNARVDIPLIETEWFNPTDTWEALPGGAEEAAPARGRGDSGEFDAEASLYDLLVAHKGRRSATNRR